MRNQKGQAFILKILEMSAQLSGASFSILANSNFVAYSMSLNQQ